MARQFGSTMQGQIGVLNGCPFGSPRNTKASQLQRIMPLELKPVGE